MARTSRLESSTGIYHIMVRGINRQSIFIEERDHLRYIDSLRECQEKVGLEVYAYCLMGNHLHLLVREGSEDIGNTMKRIGVSYVSWFNWQYDRSGHLFQGRFKSEPVEDDGYFLTVLRYIHQNPLKANLVRDIESYRWSSYSEYLDKASLVNTDFGLDIFSGTRSKAMERFIDFHNELNEDSCLDINEDNKTLSDRNLIDLVLQRYKIDLISLQNEEKEVQDEILGFLMAKDGVSLRQLSRLTGMTVHRIYKLGKGTQTENRPPVCPYLVKYGII